MTPPAEPKSLEDASSIIASVPQASKSSQTPPASRPQVSILCSRLFYTLSFMLALAFSVQVFGYEHEQALLMAQALTFGVVRKLR